MANDYNQVITEIIKSATENINNAYNQGYKDAQELHSANKSEYDRGFEDGRKGMTHEYNLELARTNGFDECANKLTKYVKCIFGVGSNNCIPYFVLKNIFPRISSVYHIFEKYTVREIIEKLDEYFKPIKLGDEVYIKSLDELGKVTDIYKGSVLDVSVYNCDQTCVSYMSNFIKTGL